MSQREYTGTAASGGTLISSTDFTYADKTNYLTGIRHYSPLGTQDITYRYGYRSQGEMPDEIYSVSWNGAEKVSYTYDGLGRLTNKKTAGMNNLYSYEDVGENRTTTLVKSVQTNAGTYTYTYDSLGNILSVNDGTYTTSYGYDSLNQLIRENDERAGKTYTYSYINGNISDRTEYAYTTEELGEVVETKSWQYNDSTWADLLTNYNGESITYDEIGNPLTMGDKELTWLGRQLQSITEGENTIDYAYNGDGQRVSKTVNGTKTEYYYNGSILAGQKSGENTLVFMYDNNSDIFGFIYNGTEYYYIKNAQNDVTAIADSAGTVIANYYYDAWGKLVETTGNTEIAELNPIRYRSYYYDAETEWYYLNTRYYSSDMCRFINADDSEILFEDPEDLQQYNLFSYCWNSPVNMVDSEGESPANIIGAIVGGVAGAALGYLLAKHLGLTGWKKAALIAAAAIGGAALGAFLGPYVAKLAKSMGSAIKTTAKTVSKVGKALCFVAGTEVLTESGKIPIEKIKVGDYVYAENPETGERELKQVVQTFVNETTELVQVYVNGEQITTTPGHPFYVFNKGWIGADDLKQGDVVLLYNREKVIIDKIILEHLQTPVKVYNFEVDEFHTYYVGGSSILVHNKGCGLNKINNSYLKKTLKLDAHAIKREYLGRRAKISLYDLAVDKKTGIIYIVDKAGKIVEKTIYKTK